MEDFVADAIFLFVKEEIVLACLIACLSEQPKRAFYRKVRHCKNVDNVNINIKNMDLFLFIFIIHYLIPCFLMVVMIYNLIELKLYLYTLKIKKN